MTTGYVPSALREKVFFEREAADGEILRASMREIEEYESYEVEAHPQGSDDLIDVDAVRVGDGWRVTYETADSPVQLPWSVRALAHIPDEIAYHVDYARWMKTPGDAAIRIRLRVLVWTQSGSPALVRMRTAGRQRIGTGFLTRRFERVICDPRESEIAAADKILADFSDDDIDRQTFHFALETGGDLGALARTVADRTRSERRAGLHSDSAEFFARAGFVGRT